MVNKHVTFEQPVYDELYARRKDLPHGKPRTFNNVLRMLLGMDIMDERRGPKKGSRWKKKTEIAK
jgi:hypothetical protein